MSNLAPAAHRVAACGCKSASASAVGNLVGRVAGAIERRQSAQVGAFVDRPMTTGERGASLVWAGAEGAFAWTLFTGAVPIVGAKVFESSHPVWGTIAGLFAIGNLADAVRGKTYDWTEDKEEKKP